MIEKQDVDYEKSKNIRKIISSGRIIIGDIGWRDDVQSL